MRLMIPLLLCLSLAACEAARLNRLCSEGDAVSISYTRFEFADHLETGCMDVMRSFPTGATADEVGKDFWLIPDQATYDTVNARVQAEWRRQQSQAGTDCDTLILPEIDFAQQSLLYVRMTTTGCEPQAQHIEVVRCDASQTYQVLLEWPTKGGCEPLISDRVWLLLPSLEPGYRLEVQDRTP